LVDGLAGLAQRTGDAELLRAASEALTRSVRLLFHDGDPCKPNSYEHYNPLTGSAALYRGYDDYMHSWVVDLILRYVAGLRPGSSERKPLPLDVAWVDCELPTG
ncbi:MAG TPA: hypothetical protein VEX38_07355, partial [Fimbriimonadaceae bacterium]|nr:hypothetical protein [Fimbriimonadaceae bacterium]